MAGYLGKVPQPACAVGGDARQPEVTVAVARLGYAAETIIETAKRLEGRLANVLGTPKPGECCDAESEPSCPLAAEILAERNRIRTADAILCDLLDRLEI